MTELYWITVLGNLSMVMVVILILSTILTPMSIIIYLATLDDGYGDSFTKGWLMAIKASVTALLISVSYCIFIPSTNQLYAIYGIGSTLDYLKENKEAQKLPDNIIKALNTYLESAQQDNNKEDNNKENNN